MKKYQCLICEYIYDEKEQEKKFEELPADYCCPICLVSKDEFEEIE